MKIFIDTANLDEIRDVSALGIVDGVTTNPSLVAKEGKKLDEFIDEICKLVDGPISWEVNPNSVDANDMVAEAKKISSINKNIVVKIPMTKEGLCAVNKLSKLGIKTNVTLVFSVSQALLAAKAGATYISPFIGRIDDIANDGLNLIYDICDVFGNYDFNSEIIAASIRSPLHVVECAKAGADICTIPYKVLMQMMKNPLTDQGINKFVNDYKKIFG